MPKRLTRQRIEEIREEVRRACENPKPEPPKVRLLLSCGHEDDVTPGINPANAICTQCRVASMRSTRHENAG
jgi:hypothetical protein